MIDPFVERWGVLTSLVTLVLGLSASAHAILYKRDSRAAIAWVGFIWFVPVLGAVLYVVFGINRLHRQAQSLRSRSAYKPPCPAQPDAEESLRRALGADRAHLVQLAHLTGRLVDRPLLAGNDVTPLVDGDEAYPAMLAAIDDAEHSIAFCTYIFDNDSVGRQFIDALQRAVGRGVQVRVLIDAVGARYSWPTVLGRLRRAGIPNARFLPRVLTWSIRYANLRSHRKLLIADGRIGFTGGINIRAGHLSGGDRRAAIGDLHFRLAGPVVAQLQEVFAEDWAFSTGERLQGETWFPRLEPQANVFARGIADGPDEDFDTLRMTILGALASARQSVRIVTPYFLPDAALITALNVAALRGVEVDIVLPQRGNLRLVQWASTAQLWQVLQHGCRVWLTPPPFDHSKVMLVDGAWVLLGSANWDPRSLRLNFEFNVECYGRELAERLDVLIRDKIASAQCVTLADVDGRALPIRLRDGIARLFSPYL